MRTESKLRFFNTTGHCDPNRHYMLPPEDRLVEAQLHRYIRDEPMISFLRQLRDGDNAVFKFVNK